MKSIELETLAGRHISSVCEEAVKLANEKQQPVHFTFNDTHVTAQPGDDAKKLETKWVADHEAARQAYLKSPEHRKQQRELAADERRKRKARLVESAKTEAEMRAAKNREPYTAKQLTEYVESLVNRKHTYGTCVYAMSLAAVAAFNYVSGKLGCSGFQASCADLDVVRRARLIDGPFILLKAEDALYPQYDLRKKLEHFLAESAEWIKRQANANLADKDRGMVHPDVLAYWRRLAGQEVK